MAMAKSKKPSSGRLAVTAKFTTLDGNRCDIKGEWPPLTSYTAMMLLCVEPATDTIQFVATSVDTRTNEPLGCWEPAVYKCEAGHFTMESET